MLTDCLTCEHIDTCDQQDRWEKGCINYKMMSTKNPTNADRIRNMSDEELAEFFVKKMDFICKRQDRHCDGLHCVTCTIDWLRQEVTE